MGAVLATFIALSFLLSSPNLKHNVGIFLIEEYTLNHFGYWILRDEGWRKI
jgi:hypothetical protein